MKYAVDPARAAVERQPGRKRPGRKDVDVGRCSACRLEAAGVARADVAVGRSRTRDRQTGRVDEQDELPGCGDASGCIREADAEWKLTQNRRRTCKHTRDGVERYPAGKRAFGQRPRIGFPAAHGRHAVRVGFALACGEARRPDDFELLVLDVQAERLGERDRTSGIGGSHHELVSADVGGDTVDVAGCRIDGEPPGQAAAA